MRHRNALVAVAVAVVLVTAVFVTLGSNAEPTTTVVTPAASSFGEAFRTVEPVSRQGFEPAAIGTFGPGCELSCLPQCPLGGKRLDSGICLCC